MKTLDPGGLEKHCPSLIKSGSCCFTLMGGLGYGKSNVNTSIHHAACLHAAAAGEGGVYMGHNGPLDEGWATLEYHGILKHQCHPFAHSFFFSRIMSQTTRLCLSRNGSTDTEFTLLQSPVQSLDLNPSYCTQAIQSRCPQPPNLITVGGICANIDKHPYGTLDGPCPDKMMLFWG